MSHRREVTPRDIRMGTHDRHRRLDMGLVASSAAAIPLARGRNRRAHYHKERAGCQPGRGVVLSAVRPAAGAARGVRGQHRERGPAHLRTRPQPIHSTWQCSFASPSS